MEIVGMLVPSELIIGVQLMPPKKPRMSLSKAQAESGIGAELVSLLLQITESGKITKEGVILLRDWLRTNKSSELSAVESLCATLKKIIVDGKISKEGINELYCEIENILPPQSRKIAAENRRIVEKEKKQKESAAKKAIKEEEKQKNREDRERQKPVHSINFMVAGVSHENRVEIIMQYAAEGNTVYLVRDRDNRFSNNAIEIRLDNGLVIGYVPEEQAQIPKDYLDKGYPHRAYITRILDKGKFPIPVVQAYLYRPDANLEDLVFEQQIPFRAEHSRPLNLKSQEIYRSSRKIKHKSGCAGMIMLIVVAIFLLEHFYGF